jgi:hypothetical protein
MTDETVDEIWMGRAEVRPLEGADPELRDATYLAMVMIAYSSSREAFEALFFEFLAEQHLQLIELEEVGTIVEVWNLDDKFLRAIETAESGDPSIIFYQSNEPEDEDPDMDTVRAAAGSGNAVQFRLIGDDGYYFGFPVEVNDAWALFHVIDSDMVALDGWAAVRADCLIEAEVFEEADTFMLQAIERRGERPLNPEVPLDGHEPMLAALSGRYPLVALRDSNISGAVAVGAVIRAGTDEVTLRGVNTSGEWTSNKQHLYKNVELIRFGSAYLSALASILPA